MRCLAVVSQTIAGRLVNHRPAKAGHQPQKVGGSQGAWAGTFRVVRGGLKQDL